MELTNRQLSILVASIEGSLSRLEEGCLMWNEVNELFSDLVREWMDRNYE